MFIGKEWTLDFRHKSVARPLFVPHFQVLPRSPQNFRVKFWREKIELVSTIDKSWRKTKKTLISSDFSPSLVETKYDFLETKTKKQTFIKGKFERIKSALKYWTPNQLFMTLSVLFKLKSVQKNEQSLLRAFVSVVVFSHLRLPKTKSCF